jgi:hypothetical protein
VILGLALATSSKLVIPSASMSSPPIAEMDMGVV